jgi:RNA polymerase sigma factor (sigma-70 family)
VTLQAGGGALERSVVAARAGDQTALEDVVRTIQDDVFDLSLRMLGGEEDARDATQEVLTRIVTKLATFRGESGFRTWVYRVAANTLLNFRKERRKVAETFEQAGEILDGALARAAEGPVPEDAAREALINEVKLACAHGMLLCLDRPHRLAYILGEVLELASDDAAVILEIRPAAFRKRLSRARDQMEPFLRAHCGLANPTHGCRCGKLLPAALEFGLVDSSRPGLAHLPTRRADRLNLRVEQARTAAEVYRSLPRYASPKDFAAAIRELLGECDRS